MHALLWLSHAPLVLLTNRKHSAHFALEQGLNVSEINQRLIRSGRWLNCRSYCRRQRTPLRDRKDIFKCWKTRFKDSYRAFLNTIRIAGVAKKGKGSRASYKDSRCLSNSSSRERALHRISRENKKLCKRVISHCQIIKGSVIVRRRKLRILSCRFSVHLQFSNFKRMSFRQKEGRFSKRIQCLLLSPLRRSRSNNSSSYNWSKMMEKMITTTSLNCPMT